MSNIISIFDAAKGTVTTYILQSFSALYWKLRLIADKSHCILYRFYDQSYVQQAL